MMANSVPKASDERPKAILGIEIVSALLFLCGLVLTEFDWWLGIAIEVGSAGVLLGLAFLVTRRRSDFARMILTILFVAGLALTLYNVVFDGSAFAEFGAIELSYLAVVWGLTITEVCLLWSQSTSRWIADRYIDYSANSAEPH
jgi:hypothetical protein